VPCEYSYIRTAKQNKIFPRANSPGINPGFILV
jgi:hypothetical protein